MGTVRELKERTHYDDRYDLHTIKYCQMIEHAQQRVSEAKNFKKGTPEFAQYKTFSKMNLELQMYFEKGELWKNKEKTIQEWMERDRVRDQLLEAAIAPKNIYCSTCHESIQSDFKTLTDRDGKDVVLFFYTCPSKHRGRAFYHDGIEYVSQPKVCVRCHRQTIKTERSRKGDIITTIERCTKCHHKTVDVLDLKTEKKDEMSEIEFKKLRKKYCISDEEGHEYLKFLVDLEEMKKITDEAKEQEEHKGLYELIASIERLTVPQLRKRVEALATKNEYTQITFEQPAISKDVQIGFSVQDESTRQSYDSIRTLTRLLEKNLAATNWSLMSEGLTFRMGVLTGRLHGYDQEDAIKQLVISRLKKGLLKLPKIKKETDEWDVTGSDHSKIRL
ncbi:MAG: hypothetical protein WCV88_00770 [Patescibacteria group bacterium]